MKSPYGIKAPRDGRTVEQGFCPTDGRTANCMFADSKRCEELVIILLNYSAIQILGIARRPPRNSRIDSLASLSRKM
jgi:hypothetical protein